MSNITKDEYKDNDTILQGRYNAHDDSYATRDDKLERWNAQLN